MKLLKYSLSSGLKEALVLEKKITSELKKLGMSDCHFKIEILLLIITQINTYGS